MRPSQPPDWWVCRTRPGQRWFRGDRERTSPLGERCLSLVERRPKIVKLVTDPGLRGRVRTLREKRWSPTQIIATLKQESPNRPEL